MALNFDDVPIPLVEGQEGGYDDTLVPPPKLLRVENGEFDIRGNIKAVEAFQNYPIAVMTGETELTNIATAARRLYTHKDTLLIDTWLGIYRQQADDGGTGGGDFALASENLHSVASTGLLRCPHPGNTSTPEVAGSRDKTWEGATRPRAGTFGMDSVGLGDYYLLAWTEGYGDERQQVVWQVKHKNGRLIGKGSLYISGADVREPKCMAFAGLFHLFVWADGDVGYISIDPASTQNVSDTTTPLITPTGSIAWFDVAINTSTDDFAVFYATDTPDIGISVFATVDFSAVASDVIGTTTSVSHLGGAYIPDGGGDFNDCYVLFWVESGSLDELRWWGMDINGISTGALSQVMDLASIFRIYPVKEYQDTPSGWPVFLTARPTGASNTLENYGTFFVAFDATGTSAMLNGNVAGHPAFGNVVAGHPTMMGFTALSSGGRLLVGVQSSSTQQFVYHVLDVSFAYRKYLLDGLAEGTGQVVPILRVFDAGNLADDFFVGNQVGRVPAMVGTPDGGGIEFHTWCAKFSPNIVDPQNLGANPTGVQRNTLNYGANLTSVEYANLTYIPGGVPLTFDGEDIVEEGFAHFPEISAVTTGGAGNLSAGNYQVVLVEEWTDARGNRWQGPPSRPFAFTAGAANVTYSIGYRVSTITLKTTSQVIPYRTTAGGTIFYRDNALGGTNLELSDAEIQSQELLYTGPGVTNFLGSQSNNALPSVSSFTEHKGRLVAIGGEDGNAFFYSKVTAQRFPAEFNRSSGYGRVSDVVGRLHAGASIDDKLVLFGEKSLAVLFGNGPNNNWLQNDYDVPSILLATEGIRSDSPQVATVAEGAWYLSTVGPRLLTRGLSIAVGQDGRPLGDELRGNFGGRLGACRCVIAHPTKNQVWFLSGIDETCYVYDTSFNKWTTRADVTSSGDEEVISLAATSSRLWKLSKDTWANTPLRYEGSGPSATLLSLTIVTGWFSLAGIQKFQRLTHLQVLGANSDSGSVASNLAVNMQLQTSDGNTQNVTVNVTPVAAGRTPWECEFQVVRQTDTRFKLTLVVTPSTWGSSFTLSGLLARVGLKPGGARLSSSKRG